MPVSEKKTIIKDEIQTILFLNSISSRIKSIDPNSPNFPEFQKPKKLRSEKGRKIRIERLTDPTVLPILPSKFVLIDETEKNKRMTQIAFEDGFAEINYTSQTPLPKDVKVQLYLSNFSGVLKAYDNWGIRESNKKTGENGLTTTELSTSYLESLSQIDQALKVIQECCAQPSQSSRRRWKAA